MSLQTPVGITLAAERTANQRWFSVDEYQVPPGDNLVDSTDDAIRVEVDERRRHGDRSRRTLAYRTT